MSGFDLGGKFECDGATELQYKDDEKLIGWSEAITATPQNVFI